MKEDNQTQWRDIADAEAGIEVDLYGSYLSCHNQRITDCKATLRNGELHWLTRSDEYGWKALGGFKPTYFMHRPAAPDAG